MLPHQPVPIVGQAAALVALEQQASQLIHWSLGAQAHTALSLLASSLPQYFHLYDPTKTYSPVLTVFWQACLHKEVLYQPYLSIADVSALIGHLKDDTVSKYISRKRYDQRYETRQLHQHLTDYATAMFTRYARVLVVRVDLGYRGGSQSSVTIDQVYQHINALVSLKTQKQGIFAHLVGYAWRLEQGVDKGYHIHWTSFYAGHQHQNDWYMGDTLGQLWLQITCGLGQFYNCNTREIKQHYERLGRLGIGMIYRNDNDQVQQALQAIGYLADPRKIDAPDKPPQHLRMRPHQSKTFATGQC